MYKRVIAWLVVHLNKKICTADQLSLACNIAIDKVKLDKDGIITVSEFLLLVVKVLKEMRYKND